ERLEGEGPGHGAILEKILLARAAARVLSYGCDMFCLECAKRGAKGELGSPDPLSVLRTLRELGDAGDVGARRLYFGILWDEGRSILCYRCKSARPVRLTGGPCAALA